jgi:hypothetical protein
MNAHSVNLINVSKESGPHIEIQMRFAFFSRFVLSVRSCKKEGLSCTQRRRYLAKHIEP